MPRRPSPAFTDTSCDVTPCSGGSDCSLSGASSAESPAGPRCLRQPTRTGSTLSTHPPFPMAAAPPTWHLSPHGVPRVGKVSVGGAFESVVLFETDADTAEMYCVGLELAGFRIRPTGSDAEALSMVRQEHPSAVIAYLGPGAIEGWELIQSVRADRSTRDVPVVVLSARTDSWTGRRAAALGCAAVLVKPCLPGALAEAVRESLQTLLGGGSPATPTPAGNLFRHQ